MDSEDRNEVRDMLTDILSGHIKGIDGQYRLIQAQLSSIEIQTTKTNSRVTKLEDKVEKVENDLEEYRMLKKYPKVGIGILIVAALLAWYGFRQLNEKVDKQGVPIVTNSRGDLVMLPDSTQILWMFNDSAKYMVKRVK